MCNNSISPLFRYLRTESLLSKFGHEKIEIFHWAFILIGTLFFQPLTCSFKKTCNSLRRCIYSKKSLFMLIFSVCFMISKGLMNDKSFQFSKKLFIEHRLWLGNCGVFGGVSLMYESISQARIHFEDSFEINFCFFKRLTQYSANGGVIFIDGGSYSMNLTNSMFYNCSSSSQGGAIWFVSSNSYIRMICANRCFASSYHFAFLKASHVNQVEFLSLSYCSHTIVGNLPIYLYNGDQRVDYSNVSMNNA